MPEPPRLTNPGGWREAGRNVRPLFSGTSLTVVQDRFDNAVVVPFDHVNFRGLDKSPARAAIVERELDDAGLDTVRLVRLRPHAPEDGGPLYTRTQPIDVKVSAPLPHWLRHLRLAFRPGSGSWATVASAPVSQPNPPPATPPDHFGSTEPRRIPQCLRSSRW